MAGQSDREKQLGVVQKGIDEQIAATKAINPTVKNRFDDYKFDFDFNTMDKNIDTSFDKTIAGINADTKNDIATTKAGTLRSLASRGISGGSIVDDTINKNVNPIITNKANTIRDLGIGKIDKKAALMDLFNRYGIDIAKSATDVDLQNVLSDFRKNNALSGLIGMNASNLQNYDDTTWLDDALGIANTTANLVKAFK